MKTPGQSGDGGLATSAELYAPMDVAVDSSGNLFIADYGSSRIRKVAANGVISTVAGTGTPGYSGDGGPATSAQLWACYGLAVSPSGDLYFSDAGVGRVRRVATTGIITTVAGNGTQGYSGDGGSATNAELNTPWGVAVDAAGNLFIADSRNGRIRRVDTHGVITTAYIPWVGSTHF